MRTALRILMAGILAAALAGCGDGFNDISPPTGKGATNGATAKTAFTGANSTFEYPDAAAGDAEEDTGL